MKLVEQIARGEKPAAFFDVGYETDWHREGVAAFEAAQKLGLSVRVYTLEPNQRIQGVAIARDAAAMQRLLDADAMPWDIRRNIEMGRALGYSADDINAYVMRVLGGRPTGERLAADIRQGEATYQRHVASNSGVPSDFSGTSLHPSLRALANEGLE